MWDDGDDLNWYTPEELTLMVASVSFCLFSHRPVVSLQKVSMRLMLWFCNGAVMAMSLFDGANIMVRRSWVFHLSILGSP